MIGSLQGSQHDEIVLSSLGLFEEVGGLRVVEVFHGASYWLVIEDHVFLRAIGSLGMVDGAPSEIDVVLGRSCPLCSYLNVGH